MQESGKRLHVVEEFYFFWLAAKGQSTFLRDYGNALQHIG